MKAYILGFVVCLMCIAHQMGAQDRIEKLRQELEIVAVDFPGLDETLDVSISGVTITEFLRTVGINHNLNLSVDGNLDQKLVTNFANAKIADVLLFLCKEYTLDMEFMGGIISIKRYVPEEILPQIVQRIPEVKYDLQTDFLSLDLKKDSLDVVAREITRLTFKNVVLAPGLEGKMVNCYIQNRPFVDALDKMCFANGLTLKQDGNFYLIGSPEVVNTADARNNKENRAADIPKPKASFSVSTEDDKLSVRCDNEKLSTIVQEVSNALGRNFFLYSIPEGEISLFVENATYEEFLSYLFHGTDYSFTLQNEVYLIGSAKEGGLVTTELVQLNHRTIENVFGSFGGNNRNSNAGAAGNASGTGANRRTGGFSGGQSPFEDTGMQIQPFPELNAFIVTGTYPDVKRFKDFVHQVDQVVPVVMIEVLIVDVNKSRTMKAGIKSGIGTNAGTTQGSITGDGTTGGINLDISTETINDLIQSFNGLGVVNLGNVSPNFYLSIQALETDGILKMRSTPKLATLNSYTASLSIGQQEYYLETSTTLSPSAANTVVTEQRRWTPVDADLTIEITPVVSGAEQVTLDISVNQSNFTTRAGENAPFGSVNREFQSSIRVKNGEMILLGGLEDKSTSSSGEGVPLLSRIPVLKWLFGSRSKTNDETKLTIFIRPTIMY
ncbi:MAG: hypothetical protein KDC12_09570 [Flavobacteriales bacterium]|nr:hypothetical protein [Flavobacteriales bacterium]